MCLLVAPGRREGGTEGGLAGCSIRGVLGCGCVGRDTGSPGPLRLD